MVIRDAGPECGAQHVKKNGPLHNGKQNPRCTAWGRPFVWHAENRLIAEAQRLLVERLVCEKISWHGIYRTVGVSRRWLLDLMVARLAALPAPLSVQPLASAHDGLLQRLDVAADAMGSVVTKKANKQGIWLALDATTRQVLAFPVGDRSRNSATQFWAHIPKRYREQATFDTDQSEASTGVIPTA